MARSRQTVDAFNKTRIELWQKALAPGDCFAVVIQHGVIFWGIVLGYDEAPNVRKVRLFCEASPDGVPDLLQVHMVDLPVTRQQFHQARALGWPSHMAVLRALVGMAKPASA